MFRSFLFESVEDQHDSIFDQHPHVTQGAIVENKRLGAVLAVIQTAQI